MSGGEVSSSSCRHLVSVIIPCYNDGRYLADAVDSVLAQSYRPVEVIVVDDGSTDNTADVARCYCDRVRLIQIPNSGPAAARNAGLRAASGEYVQFLDADDRLERRKLEHQVAFLDAEPQVGIVYGDVRYFSSDRLGARRLALRGEPSGSNAHQSWVATLAADTRPVLAKLLDQNICPVNCPLIRRDVISRVGLWNERLRAMEDWEYWLRCAAAGVAFAYNSEPETMALVRARGDSLSTDRVRMSRCTVEARIAVGSFLGTADARLTNFKHGRRQSLALGSADHAHRVVGLAWANRCPRVAAEVLGLPRLGAIGALWFRRLWDITKRILPLRMRRWLRHLRNLGDTMSGSS